MRYIKGIDRNQLMMPESLEDLLKDPGPVHIIDVFVDGLDMKELGFERSEAAETGRPGYAPVDLLKLYLYGYLNGIRSSRKLMRECRRNVEVFYLLGRLEPDFRTIADFRKDNAAGIRDVFVEFTRLCSSLKLYGDEAAVDGGKFRACNGRKQMYNENILNKKLSRIQEKIDHYLSEMEKADQEEDGEELLAGKEAAAEALKTLKERKSLYEGYLEELKQTGETQKLTTDPEARMMKTKDGFHCCYNVQTAVDRKSHMIADYQVTSVLNDSQVLSSFASQVKKTLSREFLLVTADKGYDSSEAVLSCLLHGTVPFVGFKYDKGERILNLPYEEAGITEECRLSTAEEDIQTCLKAGVLPACMEGTGVSVEVQAEGTIGCFKRDADGTVTCPMGFELYRQRDRAGGTVYGRRSACRQCTNRCTSSRNLKTVKFGPDTQYVAARMYGQKEPVISPPPGFIPNNSFFKKERIQRKVVIRMQDDPERQKERLCISEHPFGTVKWHDGAHYFLCRGIKKTTAEAGLSFLAYNLRRAVNLVGTEALLEALRKKQMRKEG